VAVNAHIPLVKLLLAQTELRENGQNVVANNLKFYKLFWFVSVSKTKDGVAVQDDRLASHVSIYC
jgi:hypothetical protein